MKSRWLQSLTLSVIFCMLASSLVAAARPTVPTSATSSEPADAYNWWIERADAPLTFNNMNPHSLGLTTTGVVNVVYGGDHLYRAYKARGSWYKETVDPAWGVGSFASLAIDSADHLHIAYIDKAAGILRYATNRSGSWQVEAQFSGIALSASNAVIGVDSGNDPHIVFYTAGTLQYISFDSGYGTWLAPETLATATGPLDYPGSFALAVGPTATPHVSYHKHVTNTNGSLYYTKRTGYDTWSPPLLLAVGGGSDGDFNDIALHGSTPHVAASSVSLVDTDTYLNEVRYTFLDGANWHASEEVYWSANNDLAPIVAIVLRLAGAVPYLAYQDQGAGYFWQTRSGDNNWSTEEAIITGASVGSWASFALNGSNLYSTYYKTATRGLSYRYKTTTWQTPEPLVTNGHQVGNRPRLAEDSLGRNHITYADSTAQQLVYARFDGAGWIHLTVDTGPVAEVSALAIYNNFPRVLYYGLDGTVRYTYMLCTPACIFPSPEIVDSGLTSIVNEPALAVHAVSGVHAAYNKNGVLTYAQRISGDNWSTTPIDSGVFGGVSLALDASGAPHLMYRKSGGLYYAYKDSVWHASELITNDNWGLFPSFKISPQGTPAAAYTENIGNGVVNVVYSARICTITCFWVPQTVAADGDEFADLAFDGRSQPAISYSAYPGFDLKLARRTAPTTWVSRVIDSRGLVGSYSSIAMSPNNGKLRIAYTDTTNSDLKLALEGVQVFVPLVRK